MTFSKDQWKENLQSYVNDKCCVVKDIQPVYDLLLMLYDYNKDKLKHDINKYTISFSKLVNACSVIDILTLNLSRQKSEQAVARETIENYEKKLLFDRYVNDKRLSQDNRAINQILLSECIEWHKKAIRNLRPSNNRKRYSNIKPSCFKTWDKAVKELWYKICKGD